MQINVKKKRRKIGKNYRRKNAVRLKRRARMKLKLSRRR